MPCSRNSIARWRNRVPRTIEAPGCRAMGVAPFWGQLGEYFRSPHSYSRDSGSQVSLRSCQSAFCLVGILPPPPDVCESPGVAQDAPSPRTCSRGPPCRETTALRSCGAVDAGPAPAHGNRRMPHRQGTTHDQRGNGAGNGNRTRVFSLEGCCTTIVLYPQTRAEPRFSDPRSGRSYVADAGVPTGGAAHLPNRRGSRKHPDRRGSVWFMACLPLLG